MRSNHVVLDQIKTRRPRVIDDIGLRHGHERMIDTVDVASISLILVYQVPQSHITCYPGRNILKVLGYGVILDRFAPDDGIQGIVCFVFSIHGHGQSRVGHDCHHDLGCCVVVQILVSGKDDHGLESEFSCLHDVRLIGEGDFGTFTASNGGPVFGSDLLVIAIEFHSIFLAGLTTLVVHCHNDRSHLVNARQSWCLDNSSQVLAKQILDFDSIQIGRMLFIATGALESDYRIVGIFHPIKVNISLNPASLIGKRIVIDGVQQHVITLHH